MGSQSVAIPEQVYGLPGLAFGGYVAGVVAHPLGPCAHVTFRKPTPLAQPLEMRVTTTAVTLGNRQDPFVEACVIDGLPEAPHPPTLEDATRGTMAYLQSQNFAYPDCFGCGFERRPGEGLRVFVGPIRSDMVCGRWTPDPQLASDSGTIGSEYVWGALDCPGAWARTFLMRPQSGAVTAFLDAQLLAPVKPAIDHVVYAWVERAEGRKTWVGSAIATSMGQPVARAHALWVASA